MISVFQQFKLISSKIITPLAWLSFLIFLFPIASFAETPDTSTCVKYLNLSDADFAASLAAVDAKTAGEITQTLALCLKYNICGDDDNNNKIQNCPATLANYTFLSDYYANRSNTQSQKPPIPPTPPAPTITSPIEDTKSVEPTTPTQNNEDTQPNTPPATPQNPPTKESIHWF